MKATFLPSDAERFPKLTGRQEPEHFSYQLGDDTDSKKALGLFERISQFLMPWQRMLITLLLMRRPDGTWTHPDAVFVIPRQNGKSLILVLRVIFGLFVLNEKILYTTQKWATGYDTYQRLQTIVNMVPAWKRRVVKDNLSQGKGYMRLKSGAQVTFVTRSADTGRGMDEVDLVIFDEAYNLTPAHVSAILPIQLASKNPQTIYASSAVNAREHPNGEVLAGLRRAGHAKDEDQLYAEYCAPALAEGAEDDRHELAVAILANPSFGVIQNAVKIKKALRVATTPETLWGFDAEYLGRGDWPGEAVVIEEDEPVIDMDKFNKLIRTKRGFGKQKVLVVDRAPQSGNVSIAAGVRTIDRKIHVEVGYYAPPSAGLIRVVLALVDRMEPDLIIMDKASPAYNQLYAELVALGLTPYVTDITDMVSACTGFYDAVEDGTLSHTGDPLITEALKSAGTREIGGAWAWLRRGNASISPLVAVTLAHWGIARLIIDAAKKKRGPVELPKADSYRESADDGFGADRMLTARF